MRQAEEVIARIGAGRVIAILRGDFSGREGEIVGVLESAGVTAVEVTLNSADALGCIGRLVKAFGGRMAVGAGTVMTVEEVLRVADAGGRFVVSPNRNVRVIGETKRVGMVSIPGCFTPSEMVEALEAGADAVKLFPAVALGVDGPMVVKALRAPLGDIRIVPTGGVDPERMRAYMKAGAWAAGVGGELIGGEVLRPAGAAGGWDGVLGRLGARAAALVAAGRDAV